MAAKAIIVRETALEDAGYLATDEQLAAIAQEYAVGLGAITGVRLNYLRILVAHSKRAAGQKAKKMTSTQTRKVVQEVHDKLYAVVLAAITTPDIAPDDSASDRDRARRTIERNRRSNFARTAKHALDTFVDAGGKLSALNPATVTKESLRPRDRTDDRGSPGRLVRSAERTSERMVKLVTRLAAENKAAARKLVNALIAELEPLTAKPLTRKTVRRGQLVLHPENRAH
jgi:hypothetical protein